jgi:hypothetical protein
MPVTQKDSHEEIMDLIDEATVPNKMSWREAIQFLEELTSEIGGRIETLREENE